VTGLFIAFEGGDACGKTTQARRISDLIGAVFTREPGGTEVGESLRELLLDAETPLGFRTEALLMAASRAQLVEQVIRPNLENELDVVSDRFLASSIVYQGYATGLPLNEVRDLSIFATNGLLPDLTILIDLPVDLAMRRRTDMPDRFESEASAFHEKVREGYLELAETAPEKWVVIDGSGSLEQVSGLVDDALLGFFDMPLGYSSS
tara:strand:- start:1123 stop:1743 length:621 start_codon:yes stop_codon:yes gene_type:complete